MRMARRIAAQPARALRRRGDRPGSPAQTDADMMPTSAQRALQPASVGTCRMGERPDRSSIRGCGCMVSPACASPTPRSCQPFVAGNTNAPKIMIGEKCAAMVLEDAAA